MSMNWEFIIELYRVGNESPWAYWYQLVTICYLGGRHAGNVLRDD